MKKYVDKSSHNFILKVLKENGISSQILDAAQKMDIDFVHIFYDKIKQVSNKKELLVNKDIIVKMLLGVYGNYIATSYFKALGYEVENEFPVLDEEGNETTRADIAYKDEQGNLYLLEVKTTPQIIDNIRNYQDENEELYNDKYYYDMDNDIIKYKEIGKKLINQSKKLKNATHNVSVVVFNGCFMDDIIKDKLEDLGVDVKVIGLNINELKQNIEITVEGIISDIRKEERKIIFYDYDNVSTLGNAI